MESFATVQPETWEACQSVDPYSFSYNRETRDDEYRSVGDLVHTLVDIVAKGGNFLLNVGPRGDGTIPEPIAERLRSVGDWMKVNGRAIYDTVPYTLLPEIKGEGVDVRVTRNEQALYLIFLMDLGSTLALPGLLPILPSDAITLLSKKGDDPVPWSYEGDILRLDLSAVPEESRVGGSAYVFEIKYAQRLE